MTLLINFLTAYCWTIAVYYLILQTIVIFSHFNNRQRMEVKEPTATIGLMAICFLIAKYLM
ncbi:MAG: hypothetical protein DWQ49_06290 [Bacteroidetes bacterium]|jgi:hypothetical protein|nr:MAG: hypothetical protein DWQ49_06290 [Bacteroidota bacterium]